MKSKEFIKIHSKSNSTTLEKEIINRENKLLGLISDAVKGKIKNVREPKAIRKEIAQLKTLLSKKA